MSVSNNTTTTIDKRFTVKPISSIKQEYNPIKIVDIKQTQIDNLITYQFIYDDGSKSCEMNVEIPEPKNGEPGQDGQRGQDGERGQKGESGKDAPKISSIEAYARQWIFRFDDGTDVKVPIKFPDNKLDEPGLSFGGQRPPVQDIRAGENITVVNNNGIFTISSTGGGGGADPIKYFVGDASQGAQYQSLQTAISEAEAAGLPAVILPLPGVYTEDITITEPFISVHGFSSRSESITKLIGNITINLDSPGGVNIQGFYHEGRVIKQGSQKTVSWFSDYECLGSSSDGVFQLENINGGSTVVLDTNVRVTNLGSGPAIKSTNGNRVDGDSVRIIASSFAIAIDSNGAVILNNATLQGSLVYTGNNPFDVNIKGGATDITCLQECIDLSGAGPNASALVSSGYFVSIANSNIFDGNVTWSNVVIPDGFGVINETIGTQMANNGVKLRSAGAGNKALFDDGQYKLVTGVTSYTRKDQTQRGTTIELPNTVEYSDDTTSPTFTIDIEKKGLYKVDFSWISNISGNLNRDANYIPKIDGVSQLPATVPTLNVEFKDNTNRRPFSYMVEEIFFEAGSHTFSLAYATESGGGTRTTTIYELRLFVLLLEEVLENNWQDDGSGYLDNPWDDNQIWED